MKKTIKQFFLFQIFDKKWVTIKDGKIVYEGTSDNCAIYIINHQPQSLYYAERWSGWDTKEKNNCPFYYPKKIHRGYKWYT